MFYVMYCSYHTTKVKGKDKMEEAQSVIPDELGTDEMSRHGDDLNMKLESIFAEVQGSLPSIDFEISDVSKSINTVIISSIIHRRCTRFLGDSVMFINLYAGDVSIRKT